MMAMVLFLGACGDADETEVGDDAVAGSAAQADTDDVAEPTTTTTTPSPSTTTTVPTPTTRPPWDACDSALTDPIVAAVGEPNELDGGSRNGLEGSQRTCALKYDWGSYRLGVYASRSSTTAAEILAADTLGRYGSAEVREIDGHDVLFNPNTTGNKSAEVVCVGGHRFDMRASGRVDEPTNEAMSLDVQAELIPVLVASACDRLIEFREG